MTADLTDVRSLPAEAPVHPLSCRKSHAWTKSNDVAGVIWGGYDREVKQAERELPKACHLLHLIAFVSRVTMKTPTYYPSALRLQRLG